MTSRLLALLLSLGCGLALAQPGDQTLNFRDADIRVFIATVSEITGRSFIVDPTVAGAKASWLARGRRVGLPVLPGFVIGTDESLPAMREALSRTPGNARARVGG